MNAAKRERKMTSPPIITDDMDHRANQAGIKLEFVNGLSIWEASPVIRHQKVSDRIRVSIKAQGMETGCACIHYADIYILFPDGSIKRPDISLFCKEPDEQEPMCRTIPDAVIEILSKGYEKKDIEVSLPFYLANGIADIVIFDPSTNRVSHYHNGLSDEYDSPTELMFTCGCRAAV